MMDTQIVEDDLRHLMTGGGQLTTNCEAHECDKTIPLMPTRPARLTNHLNINQQQQQQQQQQQPPMQFNQHQTTKTKKT